MYRLSGRQILVIALASALFARWRSPVPTIAGHFQPFGSASISPPASITDPSLARTSKNNIEVYKATAPGVVYIQSRQRCGDFFGMFSRPVEGARSGSIIDEQGDILTNYQVIATQMKLTVSFGSGKTIQPSRRSRSRY